MSATPYIPRRVVMSLPATDDCGPVGIMSPPTTRQITFAESWARTGNKSAAYIEAYQPDPMTAPSTIYAAASKISQLPAVAKRYEEIMQQRALELVVDIREALQWQFDIATADPNEITYIAKWACRHCYGVNHKYQWKDVDEFVQACVVALEMKQMPPTDEGGYGFSSILEPVHTCPECFGKGHSEMVINDTTKLQGKARKLFKGLDYKNGQWVVVMHDQQKAWELVCKMLGGFDDKLGDELFKRRTGGTFPNEIVSEHDASKAYLTLLG